MSVLNLTGEDADPVKSFVFREVSEYCRKKDQDDRISKEEKRNALKRIGPGDREDQIIPSKQSLTLHGRMTQN